MSSAASRPLTERQRAVMERIDRRTPIKVIAQELGVSETRINQHIRALKDIYEAENLADLVESFRADENLNASGFGNEEASEIQQDEGELKGYSEPVYSKNQVPDADLIDEDAGGDDPGELVMSDALPLLEQAPWLRPGEPQVVPRVLDGEHAVLFRFAAIVGIAFGLLAAVVLTVTAGITISEAMDGESTGSADQQSFS